jgi:hypothetical protein
MSQMVRSFIQKVVDAYKTGHAREHAYRPALQELFELTTGLKLINDPRRSENGASDGGKDENVFNIMQGVSIFLFVKKMRQEKRSG